MAGAAAGATAADGAGAAVCVAFHASKSNSVRSRKFRTVLVSWHQKTSAAFFSQHSRARWKGCSSLLVSPLSPQIQHEAWFWPPLRRPPCHLPSHTHFLLLPPTRDSIPRKSVFSEGHVRFGSSGKHKKTKTSCVVVLRT